MKRINNCSNINYRKDRTVKYLRLSRDDGDDRESESIENQRDIIDNFIKNSDDLEDVGEYIDDGYTGTNFNRPDFKRMIQDIEDGKIDCIITKDLSRFGRDHIDTGYYLERYLPTKAIRYIAIGDNVDTNNPSGLQFLTFKLSFNDYYAQDISNKIKSVKQRKIEKGEFQGNIAPYGYKKDSLIKNHLIPDEEAAKVVVDIFDMYVNKGMSTTQIADKLNENEILPPGIYLKIPTVMKGKKDISEYKWLYSQISEMLQNQIYIGNVVGRKFQKISHKVDKVRRTKKEEQIIVPNKHRAIISIDIWNKAQEKIEMYKKFRTNKSEEYTHPLKELVHCAECGGKAIYRHRVAKRKNGNMWENNSFICSNKNSKRNDCECKPIKLEELEEKVISAIKEEIQKLSYSNDELQKIYDNAEQKINTKINFFKKQLKTYEYKLKEKNETIKQVYKDKTENVITIEDFNIIYEDLLKEKKLILQQIQQLEIKIEETKKSSNSLNYKQIKEVAEEILSIKNPSRELYSKLIQKIEFDSQKNVIITFRFGQIEIKEGLKEAI